MLENISPFDAKCNLSSKKQTPPTRYDPPYRILSSELTLMLPLSLSPISDPWLTFGKHLAGMISVELRRSFGPRHDWQQQEEEEEEVVFTTILQRSSTTI